MGDKTGIAWTNATWNPVRGCAPVSPGCANCYAARMASRFSGPGQPYEGLASGGRWTGAVRFVPEMLDLPLRWRKPRRVFVNSMSDLFHDDVADWQIARVFAVMAVSRRHTFQILTKRPGRMARLLARGFNELVEETIAGDALLWPTSAVLEVEGFGGVYSPAQMGDEGRIELPACWEGHTIPWPLPNVWLGVSAEDQARADERIQLLLQTPAAVRFVSCEPLLGPIDFREVPGFNRVGLDLGGWWVIVGGESGPHARPCSVEWVRSIVRQCKTAGVPVFIKQLGANYCDAANGIGGRHTPQPDTIPPIRRLTDGHGRDMAEWPEDLRVREYPR